MRHFLFSFILLIFVCEILDVLSTLVIAVYLCMLPCVVVFYDFLDSVLIVLGPDKRGDHLDFKSILESVFCCFLLLSRFCSEFCD